LSLPATSSNRQQTLLPPGQYQAYIHFIRADVLDFTDVATGERHVLRIFPSQRLALGIAMITQQRDILEPAGAQVLLTVVIKVKGELAFNSIKRIDPPISIVDFKSSVPTPAQLAALPVLDFDDV